MNIDDKLVYYEYLDELRESGVTNMFVTPYLQRKFPELDKREAGAVLTGWMSSFGERHKK